MELKENRECKNSVFVDLFYEDETAEENDISLYNALHDEPLPPGTIIEKIRVDNRLYMNFKNDVSFGIGGKILVEKNRLDDLKKASEEPEYLEKLLREFDLL